MVSLTTAKLWFLIASSSQWSNGSCRRRGTLLSKHMQALQELLTGILQGSGYPAWMCILLCQCLQLSQTISHEAKPPPLSSTEYPLF